MLVGFAVVLTVAAVGLAVMAAVAVGVVLMPGLSGRFHRSTAPLMEASKVLERANAEGSSCPAAVDGR
jgi:hypothetical protein